MVKHLPSKALNLIVRFGRLKKKVKKLEGFQFATGLGGCFPTIVISELKTANVIQGHFISLCFTSGATLDTAISVMSGIIVVSIFQVLS